MLSDLASNDAIIIARLEPFLNSSSGGFEYLQPALGSNFGSKKVGVGFHVGTSSEIIANAANTPTSSISGNVNAVVLGYMNNGPRILLMDYALSDNQANVTTYNSTLHRFYGNVGIGVANANVALSVAGTISAGTISAGNISFSDSTTFNTAQSLGRRNRITNGNMLIDQRGSATTPATDAYTYTTDRWAYEASVASKASVGQNTGSVTPPSGFTKYLGAASSSAYSVTSTDFFNIQQPIEGLNISDLAWGTASAKTVTLSFWVYSSLTGTFGAALRNGAANYSYPFSYTISSANTWTYTTITVAGPTAGTWPTDNSRALTVIFSLGTGSTYSGTAGAWAAANYTSATGAVSVVGTNGATFYITGVQLEVGTKATPYEMQIYSDQLAQCQRYYVKLGMDGALFGSLGTGICNANNSGQSFVIRLPVTMRIQPIPTVSNMRVYDGLSAAIVTSISSATVCSTTNTLGFDVGCSGTVLTPYRPLTIQGNNNTAAYIDASAEL